MALPRMANRRKPVATTAEITIQSEALVKERSRPKISTLPIWRTSNCSIGWNGDSWTWCSNSSPMPPLLSDATPELPLMVEGSANAGLRSIPCTPHRPNEAAHPCFSSSSRRLRSASRLLAVRITFIKAAPDPKKKNSIKHQGDAPSQ